MARVATRQVLRSLALTAAAVAIPGMALLLAFPQRTDYVGHYLAGAGGTLALLALVLIRSGQRPRLVAAATVGAILLGVGSEATIFRLAIFDPVDLGNQSLGAVVVASALVGTQGSVRLAAGALTLAAALLVAGFSYAFR